MSSFTTSKYTNKRKQANYLYKLIDYKSFPKKISEKISEKINSADNNIPYTEGPFISSPLLHYLINNKYYDSHGSGIEDFGMTLKDFFGIEKDRFIMIETIDKNTFKITYVTEPIDEVLQLTMSDTDYDMRVFDKLVRAIGSTF
jgi:hypothetical protein